MLFVFLQFHCNRFPQAKQGEIQICYKIHLVFTSIL